MTDRLFVYGTLRRTAEGVDHPLISSACTYVGRGRLSGILYDLGAYPAVVASDADTDRVVGDVYRMHAPERLLHRLDAYEGEAYVRRTRLVETDDGRRDRAWVYLLEEAPRDAVRVASGDYHAR